MHRKQCKEIMRKDYAKTKNKVTPKQPPRRTQPKSNLEGRLWLVACVLIALFIAGLFFLRQEGTKLAEQHAVQQTKVVKPTPAPKKTVSVPEPRFDFYTMLPSGKVSAPTSAAQSVPSKRNPVSNIPLSAREQIANLEKQQLEEESSGKPAKALPTATKSYFVLQLGLFKDFAKADELKAQLVFQGIEAKIKNLKKNGSVLYRVWVGPYKSSAQAEKMQQKLKNSSVKSLLIRDSDT